MLTNIKNIVNYVIQKYKKAPTQTLKDGTKLWKELIPGTYTRYQLHREDGPAYIGADGLKSWYIHGELHRTDGPAVIEATGATAYYQNSKLHRTDGPAIITADGIEEFYVNGKQLTLKQTFNLGYAHAVDTKASIRCEYRYN